MELLLRGIVVGVLGTVVMDVLNHLVARTGLLAKIEVRLIGRMAAGWTRGRFRYNHPSEMRQVPNELVYGVAAHYGIGLGLAFIFVLGWELLVGGPASPFWALVYGIATTVASLFFVYPCMGFGVMGLRSPDSLKSFFSSLANHFYFGIGMAAGVALV